jgi:hypothetical protein
MEHKHISYLIYIRLGFPDWEIRNDVTTIVTTKTRANLLNRFGKRIK